MLSSDQFSDGYSRGFKVTTLFMASRTHSLDQAEEFSQRAWARAWEKREQFSGSCKFSSWVSVIALNLFRESFRRKSMGPIESAGAVYAASDNPEDRILVHQVLRQMRAGDAALLFSVFIKGEDFPPNCKSRVFRAKERARALMVDSAVEKQARMLVPNPDYVTRDAFAVLRRCHAQGYSLRGAARIAGVKKSLAEMEWVRLGNAATALV